MGPDSRRASVPPGWTRTKLGDVASVRSSNVDKKKRPSEVSVRLCNYMDVYSNDIVHDQLDFMVASATKTEISRFGLVDGDVVITKDSETPDDIAVPAVVRGPLSAPLVCGYHLAILRASHKRVSGEFLAFALRSSEVNAPFRKAANGSTRYGLSLDAIESAPLTLPPPLEQRRIAEILDTLDAAIRRTEQVIAKLQQMKQGLLHDLLTRGIDEHGELRDPERHPEQFKDSPLGRVPRGWETCKLVDVVPVAEYGISVSLSDSGGIPVLRMMNFADGEADLTDVKFSDGVEARSLLLKPGDVLFNRTNSIDHVGRTGIWRGQLPAASFASYLVRLVPAADRLLAEFLNRWLNWEATQIRIRRWATPGVSQVNINPTNLRRTTIALPRSLAEQERISAVLLRHDEHARVAHVELKKLRALKHGLMDDLLTGRVRVTVPRENTV